MSDSERNDAGPGASGRGPGDGAKLVLGPVVIVLLLLVVLGVGGCLACGFLWSAEPSLEPVPEQGK